MLLTDIDGLHSADPRHRPQRATDRRGPRSARICRALRSATRPRRSAPGGCARRCSPPRSPAPPASPPSSATACAPGALEAALAGQREGTYFHTGATRHSSFKLWLRYAKPARGHGDRRRRRAPLLEQGRACCPSASSRCAATSTPATPSRSRRRGGASQGRFNYSAHELRRVKGLKSDAIPSGSRTPPTRPCTATRWCSRRRPGAVVRLWSVCGRGLRRWHGAAEALGADMPRMMPTAWDGTLAPVTHCATHPGPRRVQLKTLPAALIDRLPRGTLWAYGHRHLRRLDPRALPLRAPRRPAARRR